MIDRACEEIKNGALRDQLIVDVMQGGAGTSTNMNVNEVIANRGLELAGHAKGDYQHLDPNDHVNCSQSTNDTYPTALKIGLCLSIERLLAALLDLSQAFHDKGREFRGVLKVGRTQLQDAVPMTLEQEFEAFAISLAEDTESFETIMRRLWETNMGATAIGTGIAAAPGYTTAVRMHLAAITGYDIVTARNLVEATTDVSVFMELSAALKRTATKLSKICNDVRLLSSGPQAGLGEIKLPARQAGSSIMPGKVNPVIPEVVNSVAFVITGADVTLIMAAEAGQLQLNAFGPGDGSRAFRESSVDDGSHDDAARELCGRDHCQPGSPGRSDCLLGRRDHRARSPHWICGGVHAGQGRARDESEHRGPRRVVRPADA